MKVAIVAGLFVFVVASPSFSQTAADEIEKANQRFEKAFNTGDAARVARMYAERATVLPPGSEMVQEREAIQKFWQAAIDAGLKNLSLKSVRVDEYGGGEAAREIGRFSFDAPAPQGGASAVNGKYVVLWRKNGGEWQLDTDIWNLSKSPEPAVATGSSAQPAQ